jgi:hypothetical protein
MRTRDVVGAGLCFPILDFGFWIAGAEPSGNPKSKI